jgi:dynein heavy chain
MKLLVADNGEAKDNSKLLNNLERQFKILQAGDLTNIEQCISSLLNGLRLVFIISRYYKTEEHMLKLLVVIANEICDRVKERVNIKELLRAQPDRIYEEQLSEGRAIIEQGRRVLRSWIDEFTKTKAQLEADGGDRWDFPPNEIKRRANDMINVLDNFQHITIQLERLLELLGPKLKSVAGSTERLDHLVKRAKDLVRPIEDFQYDFFAKEFTDSWKKVFERFKGECQQIQKDTTKLIEDTFNVLRSSETGFEFLQKFKVDSLEEVNQNLNQRYTNVLDNYRKELEKNEEIFKSGKDKQMLTKNRPPVAGKIAWKKSILRRIKAPIVRFIEKEHLFNNDEFNKIKQQYKDFFDTLDDYEKAEANVWRERANAQVDEFLKKPILKKVEIDGEQTFVVNFPPQFRVLISEAKYLDRMVDKIDQKVLNIALQEEEYYRYIDKIEKMLREYNQTVGSLKDVEKDLLKTHLKQLRAKLEPGAESYFLNSLGINDFIASCSSEIKRFNDKKNRVEEKTRNIEDIIKTIEEAKIIKDYDFKSLSARQKDLQNYPTLQDFIQHFEKFLNQQVESLAEKYSKIGLSMLPNIAMAVFESKGENNKHPDMRNYYYYWERRVYNALVKMIVRALITYKTLLRRPRKANIPNIPLFKVVAEFPNQIVTINPIHKEITASLEGLRDTIIKAAAWFPRWKDGTCIPVDRPAADKGFEERGVEYTFAEEIMKNKVVTDVSLEINDVISHAIERVKKLQGKWEINEDAKAEEIEGDSIYDSHRRGLFNPKHKINVDKIIEKNPITPSFEFNLEIFHQLLKEYEAASNEADADFIKVDFTKVKKAFESQAKERIKRIAAILIKIVDKESEDLKREIFDYYIEIRKETYERELVKKCLNTLTKIRDSTEDKEAQIAELTEKCRLLKKYEMYGIDFDAKKYEDCMNLGKYWNKLLHKAKAKNNEIKGSITNFTKTTQDEVRVLNAKIDKLYDLYTKTGPSAVDTNLISGIDKLDYFRKEVDELNASKAQTVKMQKLFGIDVAYFPKLNEMDDEMKKLEPMYSFYAKMRGLIDELSRKQWDKFDTKELEDIKKMFKSKVKDFSKNDTLKNTLVFKKLEAAQIEFEKPLAIIEQLKSNQHFKDSHWERLLNMIDKPTEGINFSQITLQQVLNLNLSEYQEKVEEIMAAAHAEFSNKKSLTEIEEFWRNANFEVAEHKKGGFKVKVPEEIKAMLDDNLNSLQAIEGSKNAGPALKKEVREWMKNLVTVQDTIEEWIKVQTKWLYLEGIYIGNEDIRAQLSKETKTFEQHHKTFKNLNEKVSKNTNIYANCVLNNNTLSQLQNLSQALDKSQKSLTDYLNSKKKIFPRFYFISDEDLLSILGSSDVASIQPQLNKLFDNVKSLEFERGKVTKVFSDEGEFFSFFEPYKPDGAVEVWMTKVDEIMLDTLRKLTKEGVFMYAKMDRAEWMFKYLGMIVIVTRQIWWTWRVEDVFRKVKEGDKYAMKKEARFQTEELNFLVAQVRSDLEAMDPTGKYRKKINNLIIVDVHARDIVDRFVRDSILDAREFEWESQLRFYWRNNINDIQIDQCTGHFRYGYEYQGLTSRLVITPLTDRCVMTLTTALTFCLGGAPAGPAGTGKTETCKDLGKNLAVRAVVTNCGENFDVLAMGTNYSGLCQTGFWGVFDEFNRILPEVLSVVSTQIGDIQRALVQGKTTVEMLDQEVALKATVGIFVTMNPGYEGRSELPDNLKALFRPVTMVVPDMNIICENMLMSEGFQEARMLAKKMTELYKLAKEQLSKQYHYDFGLRALKSVLVMAGSLKRGAPDLAEEDVLMRALKDMNMPKFVYEDVGLFQGLLTDLFPGRSVESVSHKDLNENILRCQGKKGLQELQIQAEKVIQLYETMETRHTTMVVGPTGAGKTTVIDLLRDARTVPSVRSVVYYIINPKAQGLSELYGILDPQTREWKDGILSKTFKFINEEPPERGPTDKGPKEEIRWILFDGDVDAVWVENMNSVMDDNKLLTLSNGDRIKLKSFSKLLFEVYDLQYASPATISRCGMVYVDPKNLGYEHYFNSWRNKLIMDKEHKDILLESFTELYGKYVRPLVDYIFEGKSEDGSTGSSKPIELSISRTNLNLVQQFTNIMDCLLPEDINTLASETIRLEGMFVYSCVWSFGSCIKSEEEADKFSTFIKGITTLNINEKNLQDLIFEGSSFVPVKNKVTQYIPPPDGDFSKILVPTVDTVKFNHLLSLFMSKAKPTLFVGEPGTAKTVIIRNYLSQLKIESYVVLNMNFSSRTDSMEVQRSIESVTDKRRQGIYGPKGNKKLIVFIDELHMPKVDKYGTQQPIALLKFLIDKKLMYERGGSLEKREYRDCQYVAALLPPGGGYNSVDPRFLSLFNCVSIQFPKEENIRTIYNSILQEHFKGFPKEFEELSREITIATYKIYQKIVISLPRSPTKFHYIFNLRDLSRVYQGLLRSKANIFNSKEKFIKLWKHECNRVFVDRLITEIDKKVVQNDIMNDVIRETFGDEIMKKVNEGDLLFGDFKDSQPLEPEFDDPKIYQSLESYEKARAKCEELLGMYNEENPEMPLVLFNDAVDHLIRLIRVIRFPRGNAMLVGFGGSGKQSLTKLATFICSYSLYTIMLKKNYGESLFRKDLFDFYNGPLMKEPQVFMFTDTQIIEDSFLELINTMLTVGVINNLFDQAARSSLITQIQDKLKRSGAADEMWEVVCDYFRKSLHIVLCMSPAGDALRVRCRNFPGLISSTTIDWFFPWPAEALKNVAEVNLKEMNFEPALFDKIVSHFVFVHMSIPEYARKYELSTRRKVFNTPKNYLDFLKCYMQNLEKNKKNYLTIIADYERGLDKLKDAKIQVEELKKEIEADRIVVEARKDDVSKISADIKQKQIKANEQSAAASEKQAILTVKNKEIAEKKATAEQLYQSKLPELEAARNKVAKMDKGNLTFVASLTNPPHIIKEAGKLVLILKVNKNVTSTERTWDVCQQALKDPSILDLFKYYKIETASQNQINEAEKLIKSINENLGDKSMEKISSAIDAIFVWAQALIGLYGTFTMISQLNKNVETLTTEQKMLQEDLELTNKQIKDLNDSLAVLSVNLANNQKELRELNKKFEEMTMRLNNAVKLLDGLGSEEINWTKDKEAKKLKIQYFEGECLSCASFLSYFGPFDQEFRKSMAEVFYQDIKNKEILIGENFNVKELLTTDVQVTTWNSQGLPSDELSTQNAILTTQSTRYPLCIDPQLQAIKWIKNKEKSLQKYTTNFNDPELVRKLENAFKEGEAILIENILEDLDPIIDNVLLKKYFTVGGIQKVKIGDRDVDVPISRGGGSEFIMYLTTKLPNPYYTPEIMGKTSVINYTVNMNGLTEQLLSEVIKNENPEQEKLRNDLINQTSESMQTLKMLQSKILESLVNSKKDIIQDIDLINNLQSSKTKSKEIEENLEIASKTKATLEAARLDYVPVAKRGAILFFCMQKMSAISDMYQYSLSSYLEVFKRSLTESTKDDVVITRIKIIIDKLTQNVYDYITLGIFKIHRRTFTFQMVLMIREGEGRLNRKELDFFLKGNTSMGDLNEGKTISWLTENNCKDIEALVEVGEVWKKFYVELRDKEDEWKKWFDLEDPEENPMPAPYGGLIKDKFQLLMILRVMRPDRISLGIDKMITEYFANDHYIRVPVLKDKWLLSQTSSSIPIIFILSPGADPSAYIRNLANNEGFTNKKFLPLSLGQGMEKTASEYVKNAWSRGYWVLLQNCDLLPACIKNIEKEMEGYGNTAAPDFRLWLTTQPTQQFPLGILQRALKIVTEPPAGIKNNMEDVINRITEDSLNLCKHFAYKPLTYVLVFMHAVILDRAKYGKIGWNVTYDFNYSDFQISYRLLNLYLTKSLENKDDTIPWDSLKYLIGEAMYGGRVTDEFDRRTLMTYLDEYMGDFLFDKNHEFFFAESMNYKYRLPVYVDKQSLTLAANSLPNADSPVVFGLHSNAEITYYTNDAKNLWTNFLKMESVGGTSVSPQERDRIIDETAVGLLDKTLFEMDVASARSRRLEETKDLKPTDVVLFQEMDRFRNLSIKIQSTLSNLRNALSGKIGMNAELDELAVSLYNSFLPPSWAKLAPETQKKLGSWITHFIRRKRQYEHWYQNGEPTVMWLSGLHIPASYLTALVQTTCRAKGWALDKSTLFTDMTNYKDEREVSSRPEQGCYITGLYLEGVSWDMNRKCIRAQHPKELINVMPIIKIVPEESNKLKLKDRMKVPVYVTQNRRNAKGVGHVFDADLETHEHPSHWILQGAALVLNTDE